MKITITSHSNSDQEWYEWNLIDGPDDKEKVKGFAKDIETAFVKVIEWRERIAMDYECALPSEEGAIFHRTTTPQGIETVNGSDNHA